MEDVTTDAFPAIAKQVLQQRSMSESHQHTQDPRYHEKKGVGGHHKIKETIIFNIILTPSLSLGVPVPRATECMRGA